MDLGQSDYRSFLLRLWRVEDGGSTVWRASLQDVETGERRGFASPEELIAFLLDQVNGNGAGPAQVCV